MMKLDLKDAYYTVPVHRGHLRYLRFSYQGTLYEFSCLPFGLSSAPRAFTKLFKPIASLLCSMGVQVVIYLDDILLLDQDPGELKIFNQVLELFQNLGFSIKKEKCSSVPTQSIIFLGGLLNSTTMTISLPSEKVATITQENQEILAGQGVTVKVLSSLIGRMSHAAQTGIWTALLHYRNIQRQLVKMTRQSSMWLMTTKLHFPRRAY